MTSKNPLVRQVKKEPVKKAQVKKTVSSKREKLLKTLKSLCDNEFDLDDYKYASEKALQDEIKLLKYIIKSGHGKMNGGGFFDIIANAIPTVAKFIPILGGPISAATSLTLQALNPLRAAENRYRG